MTLEKERPDQPVSSPGEEAEEILRRNLVAAQMAYQVATPEEKPLARRSYLAALNRFTDLVMRNRIPDDFKQEFRS